MNPKVPPPHERAHDVFRERLAHPLRAMLAPETVAIIGATDRPGSVGQAVTANLSRFEHPVFLVNPQRAAVMGRKTYPEIAAVPQPVSLAVIVTPASTVPGVVRQCVEARVPSAVILSAGFKECGPEGAALEARVLEEAARGGLRVLGPNCLGVMVPHLGLNATFAATLARPGRVAFLSQSGALCTAILDWSLRENVGFSGFVSVGSMLDVGWGDLITYFGDDPNTRSIICYMESVGDARGFLSAAREVALTKPVIVLKVGRTAAAAKAAASHTGSLTGSDAVLDAAFRRVGVLRVGTIEELFDMSEVLAKQPRPHGRRLVVVTNAGGPGALATDALVAAGGQLAELSASTLQALNGFLPPHWSHGNPIDILGDADAERYARTVEIVGREEGVDGVLTILTPQAMTDATATAARLQPLARLDGKVMLASWMGGPSVEVGENLLNQAGIPTYRYPDRAARAWSLICRFGETQQALYETPIGVQLPEETERLASEVEGRLKEVRAQGRTLLTEAEAKQVLAAFGIPVVETRVARTEDEAVSHAEALGFPVAVKLFSHTLTHKSDVGGVQLDQRTPEAVRHAWRAIEQSVTARAGRTHFGGVTVQPMVARDGCELILGSSVDPQFGPVLLFGAGGQLVEVFQDRALGLPPLNRTLARRMIEQTRVFRALQGVRGRPPVNLAALEDLLVRFSQLVVGHPWIAEIDVNPLLASADRLIALDARMVLHPPDTAMAALPRPAIRPYPTQYVSRYQLKDGSMAILRPIRPEDEPLMVKFHRQLSERSVYLRYFAPMKLDERIAHERLSRLCFIDYDREMALVAERTGPGERENEILGVGRLSKLHGVDAAEFAVTVSDQWHRQGLGTQLLRQLVEVGRAEGLQSIVGTILSDNHEMLRVARKVGFSLSHDPKGSETRAELKLKT